MSLTSFLKSIADALRAARGTTAKIYASQFATLIRQLNDTSAGTAEAADILLSKIAFSKGSKKTGTMPDNGAVSQSLSTSVTSYTIPKGYHNGNGKVSITTESKSVTPTASAQSVTPTAGKLLASVSVGAIPSTYIQVKSYATTGTLYAGSYSRNVQVNSNTVSTVKYVFVYGQGVDGSVVVPFSAVWSGTNTSSMYVNGKVVRFTTATKTTSNTTINFFIIGS